MLNYSINKFTAGYVFQVTSQSNKVDNWLANNTPGFMASNGWLVTSYLKPEIDEKRKVIFLRGSETSKHARCHRSMNIPVVELKNLTTEIATALEEFKSFLAGQLQFGIGISPVEKKKYYSPGTKRQIEGYIVDPIDNDNYTVL